MIVYLKLKEGLKFLDERAEHCCEYLITLWNMSEYKRTKVLWLFCNDVYLISALKSGTTLAEMGKHVGCNHNTVGYRVSYLIKNGIKLNLNQ